MTGKHTKGPWLREGAFVYALNCGINRFSAYVQNDNHDATAEEIEANARLISKAPELVECLQKCAGALMDRLINSPRTFSNADRIALAQTEQLLQEVTNERSE